MPSGIAAYTLSEDLIGKMKASACYNITIAIESGNQYVLTNLMKKPMQLHLMPDLVKAIRSHGIRVPAFLMLGYPDENKAQMHDTIEFAKSLDLDLSYFSVASPLPNTKMRDTCIKKGYIKEEDFNPLTSFHICIIRTPGFDPDYVCMLFVKRLLSMSVSVIMSI